MLALGKLITAIPPKFAQDNPSGLEFKTIGPSTDTEDDDVLFNQVTNFTTQPATHFDYHQSTINIKNTNFQNCLAYGKTDSGSSGGAFFVTESSVSITGGKFTNCVAMTGGAMVLFCSQLLITKADGNNENTFENNNAFQYAGDIYASGVENENDQYNWIYIKYAKFSNSKSSHVGGSLVLQLQSDVYIEGCTFENCQCGSTGGSMFISSSPTKIYKSSFKGNSCGLKDFNVIKNGTKPIFHSNSIAAKHAERSPLKKSGGAIAFHSNGKDGKTYDLTTQLCKFGGNKVENSNLLKSEKMADSANDLGGYGFDLYISGLSSYNSFNDTFSYKNEQEFEKYSLSACEVDKPNDNLTRDSVYTILKPEYNFWLKIIDPTSATSLSEPSMFKVTFKTATNMINNYQKSIPSPTNYTYCATPITRYPFATTQSHKYPSMLTFTLTKGDTLSVMATPAATASPSVSQSPTASDSIDTRFPTKSYTPSESPYATQTPSHSVSATPSVSQSLSASFTASKSPRRTTPAPTASTQDMSFNVDETAVSGKSNLIPIIVGVGCGLFIMVIACALIWFLVFSSSGRRSSSSGSGSSVEMMEETVLNFPETQENIITQDNPLWTTSVMGADDDPFRNDFEEADDMLFFRVNRSIMD